MDDRTGEPGDVLLVRQALNVNPVVPLRALQVELERGRAREDVALGRRNRHGGRWRRCRGGPHGGRSTAAAADRAAAHSIRPSAGGSLRRNRAASVWTSFMERTLSAVTLSLPLRACSQATTTTDSPRSWAWRTEPTMNLSPETRKTNPICDRSSRAIMRLTTLKSAASLIRPP